MKALFTILLCLSLSLVFFTHMTYGQSLPEMILVEGGTFQMGDELDLGEENERPVHKVTLRPFSISKTEVTVGQYKQYCNETGVKMPDPPEWGWIDSHPMVNVSRHDAMNYCYWLKEKTGKLYMLPTEAQWEYVAKGGKNGGRNKYSGGKGLPLVGWFGDNSGGHTNPVAQKHPNELGIYDMSGNVWEWCLTSYEEYDSSPRTNPWPDIYSLNSVLRGGSFSTPASMCRVSYRFYFDTGGTGHDAGFRVVLIQ